MGARRARSDRCLSSTWRRGVRGRYTAPARLEIAGGRDIYRRTWHAPREARMGRLGAKRTNALRPHRESNAQRIGENSAGITNAFSCFTTTPGGLRAGHCPVADAAARTDARSLASL